MEESVDNQRESVLHPNSSSSASASTSQVVEEEIDGQEDANDGYRNRRQQLQTSTTSYFLNFSVSNVASMEMRDDVWYCTVVLVTFWLFAASMTLILGFYGSVNLQLGPNCSQLIEVNALFVQSIKAEEIDQSKSGPVLYGFDKPPPLDVIITWSEAHNAFVPVNFHKEWIFFLNKGSKMDISYDIKSSRSLPLSLVIAKGKESLVEWVDDPSYPNTTLFWYKIHGSGNIKQEIVKSSTYYIAVGNFNSEEVEVELRFTLKAFLYNTTRAYYKCSLNNRLCSLKVFLLRATAAVLTSPHPEEGTPDDDWYIKLSYGPRWITYFLGSGVMTVLILLAFRIYNLLKNSSGIGQGFQAGEVGSERAPLLLNKDDDLLSWGSSYESISHDEEDMEKWLATRSSEEKPSKEGGINNPRRLCLICLEEPRNCFFLPCTHCAACFTCGTSLIQEGGTCPVCSRKMKKARKIFTV